MSRGKLHFLYHFCIAFERQPPRNVWLHLTSPVRLMFSPATQQGCHLEDTLLDLHVRMFPIRLADRESSILKVSTFQYEYMKRSGDKENNICFLFSRECAFCSYPLLPSVFSFFSLLICTPYEGLSWELSDVHHQFGTAEITSFRDWRATGFLPLPCAI